MVFVPFHILNQSIILRFFFSLSLFSPLSLCLSPFPEKLQLQLEYFFFPFIRANRKIFLQRRKLEKFFMLLFSSFDKEKKSNDWIFVLKYREWKFIAYFELKFFTQFYSVDCKMNMENYWNVNIALNFLLITSQFHSEAILWIWKHWEKGSYSYLGFFFLLLLAFILCWIVAG